EDRLLDRRDAFASPGNLDEKIGARAACGQLFRRGGRAGGVVGEPGGNLERHPSVDPVGTLVDRAEQIGGAREVVEREFEEQRLALFVGGGLLAGRRGASAGVLDRVVEDGRVGGQTGDRQLVDVAFQGAG